MTISRRNLLYSTVSALALSQLGPNVAFAHIKVGSSPKDKKTLVRMLRLTYPHARFPDGPYERTADSVIAKASKSPAKALMLRSGLNGLRANSFDTLDDVAATKYLKDIESSEFFQHVRGTAVVGLYNDHEVWGLLGYEGPSFDKGVYINRGFNDLKWLPEPRITEYSG